MASIRTPSVRNGRNILTQEEHKSQVYPTPWIIYDVRTDGLIQLKQRAHPSYVTKGILSPYSFTTLHLPLTRRDLRSCSLSLSLSPLVPFRKTNKQNYLWFITNVRLLFLECLSLSFTFTPFLSLPT